MTRKALYWTVGNERQYQMMLAYDPQAAENYRQLITQGFIIGQWVVPTGHGYRVNLTWQEILDLAESQGTSISASLGKDRTARLREIVLRQGNIPPDLWAKLRPVVERAKEIGFDTQWHLKVGQLVDNIMELAATSSVYSIALEMGFSSATLHKIINRRRTCCYTYHRIRNWLHHAVQMRPAV